MHRYPSWQMLLGRALLEGGGYTCTLGHSDPSPALALICSLRSPEGPAAPPCVTASCAAPPPSSALRGSVGCTRHAVPLSSACSRACNTVAELTCLLPWATHLVAWIYYSMCWPGAMLPTWIKAAHSCPAWSVSSRAAMVLTYSQYTRSMQNPNYFSREGTYKRGQQRAQDAAAKGTRTRERLQGS
jgi:hypothetical protein